MRRQCSRISILALVMVISAPAWRAALAIRNLPDAAWQTPSMALVAMVNALRRALGGSSGPFYATGLLRAARRLTDAASPAPDEWANAFTLAVEAISDLGGAVPGDRTMLDALDPAAPALNV